MPGFRSIFLCKVHRSIPMKVKSLSMFHYGKNNKERVRKTVTLKIMMEEGKRRQYIGMAEVLSFRIFQSILQLSLWTHPVKII